MERTRILVVGSINMDMTIRTKKLPEEGETVTDGISFSTAPGGKGANQAVQAARLGAHVTMVGCVGRDAFGDELLKSLAKEGINISHVRICEDAGTGIANILLEEKEGEKTKNRIIVVSGANMKIDENDILFLEEDIQDFDMVILQMEIPMEINRAVVQYAYSKGVPVMFNPAPPSPLSSEVLEKIEFIAPNKHEAEAITGFKIIKDAEGVDIESTKMALLKLLDMGVENAVITLGSDGVCFMNKTKFLRCPCINIVQVIDPTAAGDSFISAFCMAICNGIDEEKALWFASYAAAVTVSRLGAQPSLPNYHDVVQLAVHNNDSRIYKLL